MKKLLLISVAALLMLPSGAAAQAQTQQPSGLENLKAAHTSCVERTFHLSDTNPATVERVFAACQTEEQALLSAVALAMRDTLLARFTVDRYKLDLKWRLLNDAAKLQRTLGKTSQ